MISVCILVNSLGVCLQEVLSLFLLYQRLTKLRLSGDPLPEQWNSGVPFNNSSLPAIVTQLPTDISFAASLPCQSCHFRPMDLSRCGISEPIIIASERIDTDLFLVNYSACRSVPCAVRFGHIKTSVKPVPRHKFCQNWKGVRSSLLPYRTYKHLNLQTQTHSS